MQPAAASGSAGAGQPRRLSFNGLDGHRRCRARAAAVAEKGFAFVVGCAQAKEFALAHWLVNGAEGSRLFVRCFDGAGTVRENAAGDVLASLTTMQWNVPSISWAGGRTVAERQPHNVRERHQRGPSHHTGAPPPGRCVTVPLVNRSPITDTGPNKCTS